MNKDHPNGAIATKGPEIDFSIDDGTARIVPEFIVYDIEASRKFWIGLLKFGVVFDRPTFAYLRRDTVEIMLTEKNGHRETGALEKPLGRGINFQLFVGDVDEISQDLKTAGWTFYEDLHEAWYRSGSVARGYRQFLVQDPDGYLIRFAHKLGRRETEPSLPSEPHETVSLG
jgi:catechol 2,3-dioxygenase-like lactoylglutathione lyase family enzyme